ncbi:hypothetical protein AAZX31_11G066100 [Glycine max]|uniref:Late embryogenesis abundant protein n=2 Tax=Glycine subgen. Soja TaxID=1462606 RepID=I1LHR9_SOYBN|nr:uncharacterized protein LOC100819278 [Glycine max]XP_028189199.1 uncharacterized protein LOC114375572 [Glycine soja]KAG4987919.1 hypothetical protein JHK85_030902 [Glycine max]KAG4993538.1 hypothetical protein JHK86_030365 [Glycine max]KAH1157926.1 hypothetical protein GYH30_030253 [Glycine max]KAH1223915.1 hypothetical protein GmHk_11G031265 [Glycine max]KRH28667.1 hypothetical protein GLYMA_11G067900v4 [Glycine max]|eukprot:XP_003537584.1 uncharacterized protein LOC100819278 [Glycine max]
MFHSIKTVLTCPQVSFPARSLSSNLGRETCAVRFCTDSARKMDKTQKPSTEENKQGDTMSHSFGEGYATRSDEEGFGGVYGGNQSKPEMDPAYDKTQGSEVKEKEKARHQTSAN